VDYAMLIKLYGIDPEADTRYSPAKCIGIDVRPITGDPDPKHIGTSHVERQNLTMRMGMRRLTRLTNAFSRKVDNLYAAVSLHFMYYNFARPTRRRKTRTHAPRRWQLAWPITFGNRGDRRAAGHVESAVTYRDQKVTRWPR
jgi:hypothetical protein